MNGRLIFLSVHLIFFIYDKNHYSREKVFFFSFLKVYNCNLSTMVTYNLLFF